MTSQQSIECVEDPDGLWMFIHDHKSILQAVRKEMIDKLKTGLDEIFPDGQASDFEGFLKATDPPEGDSVTRFIKKIYGES